MAPLFKITTILSLSLLVAAQGTQFITGPCKSDADCASGCCGFKSGKCAGAVVAQERDGGCGFGDAQPNAKAAQALGFTGQPGQAAGSQDNGNAGGAASANAQAAAAPAPTSSASGGASAGNGKGTQFITGACSSDADCASGCCGFKSGKCAGAVVAQERDGGCGFGDAQPNANAAKALGFTGQPGQAAGSQNSNANAGNADAGNAQAAAATAATAASAASAPAASGGASGANGAGNGAGKQFITGPCSSDADCANGCCGFKSGKCAGAVVAQERDGGCGFGDAQPNDNAAQALKGQRLGRRGAAYM